MMPCYSKIFDLCNYEVGLAFVWVIEHIIRTLRVLNLIKCLGKVPWNSAQFKR
jgi:hypothetical protein